MIRMPASALALAVRRQFVAHGLPDHHAIDAADTLVQASLMGVDTHGISLLPVYLKELDCGRANARPDIRLHTTRPGACLMDADNALGLVAGRLAAREAVSRARASGAGVVSVSRSNHLGASGVHARMIAAENQIGIVLTNSDALVVPANGSEALCGTNPIACAAPGLDDDGFFLDMATSVVAFTRVLTASRCGTAIPSGWAVDREGRDASLGGAFTALMPLGGYKGQGLGMLVQILCAVLTGMPFDAELQNMYTEPFDQPRNISHCFISIDIDALLPVADFRARLSDLLTRFRKSRAAEGAAVLVPGDIESRTRTERLREGIPIPDALLTLLNDQPVSGAKNRAVTCG